MMENLALYVIVALFLAGVSFTLNQIFTRLTKNERELKDFKNEVDKKICANYDVIRDEYKSLAAMIENNSKGVVSESHCEAKQELWGERFNNMMDKFDRYLNQNEKEHGQIINTMTSNASARTQQMVDLSERVEAVSECLKNLQLNKDC